MDYSRYPKNWKQISLRIRERDNWQCKFCGVDNGAVGYRRKDGSFVEFQSDEDEPPQGFKQLVIMLTVAHLGVPKPDGSPGDVHDKMDCRDENLAALCQRCHLRYDLREHVQNAHRTRRLKRVKSGQLELF